MVINEMYTLTSGTTTDAYDLSNKVDVFLVSVLGWARQHTISSGVSNIDRVYYNVGGEAGNLYDGIYYRLQAVSGTLFNHAYSYYASGGSSYSGHITGYEETSNPGAASGTSYYKLIGNKNVLWVISENPFDGPGSLYASSIGYGDSYYETLEDAYPVCLVGQSDSSYDFSCNRVMMYGPDNAGQYYTAENYQSLVKYGAPQPRDESYFGMSIALMNSGGANNEIRAELRGVKQVGGISFFSGDTVVYSGPTVSGTFCTVKHNNSDDTTFLFGPYEEV